MAISPLLIDGTWQEAHTVLDTFRSFNPLSGEANLTEFPVIGWADLDRMVEAGEAAAAELASIEPERIARFLERYADLIEERRETIVETAQRETALGAALRLGEIELPRTTGQLRQAAAAVRDTSSTGWSMPIIDAKANIRSRYESLGGVVLVIGPNNFPLAFNAISGSDFASAIAAGNPVIAKGHPAHPETTHLLADAARAAVEEVGLPSGTVQCFHHAPPEEIARLIDHPGLAAVAFTGGQSAGIALKKIADAAGKPGYFEMSSLNPVVLMPSAAEGDLDGFAALWTQSIQMGSGQFCTKPGLCFVIGQQLADTLGEAIANRFDGGDDSVLLTKGLVESIDRGVRELQDAGAILLAGGATSEEPGFRYPSTLLMCNGRTFREMPESMQRELFGPAGMIVACESEEDLRAALRVLEGQLTACIWATDADHGGELYEEVRRTLRPICGRLLENKMPTGVAVVPSMVHGGPYPASSHPGFTSVGMPGSIRRFAALRCYDGVPESRLPATLV
jgi:alpha-ketoglutaric semialdehyde dehydrogenase